MSCCCQSIYKFCEPVDPCNQGNFKKMFSSLADGAYTVELEFLSYVKRVDIVKTGSEIKISAPFILNEDFSYIGRLKNDAGDPTPFYYASVAYDCFEFDTKIHK